MTFNMTFRNRPVESHVLFIKRKKSGLTGWLQGMGSVWEQESGHCEEVQRVLDHKQNNAFIVELQLHQHIYDPLWLMIFDDGDGWCSARTPSSFIKHKHQKGLEMHMASQTTHITWRLKNHNVHYSTVSNTTDREWGLWAQRPKHNQCDCQHTNHHHYEKWKPQISHYSLVLWKHFNSLLDRISSCNKSQKQNVNYISLV